MKDDLLVPLFGVLVAAVIAAITSLVVSILSKDQKTSEFRLAWIDAFREDAANLAGHWCTMIATLDAKKAGNGDPLGYIEDRHDDIVNLEVRIMRMRLRLNPNEHAVLIGRLNDLGDCRLWVRKELDDAMEAIILDAQEILRHEWKRVKRGELSFMLLKWISLAVFVIAVVLLVVYAWCSLAYISI